MASRVADVDRALDMLKHSERYRPEDVASVEDAAKTLLRSPLTTERAAELVGVSKPTVLAWIRAGILDEAPGSRGSKHLLEPLQVFAVRHALRRTQLQGSLQERAEQLRGALEAVYWAAHPDEQARLQEAIGQADAGHLVPAADALAALDDECGPLPPAERAKRRQPRSAPRS